ncbi:MAG: hypothetical protein ABFR63_06560 [Thermodesulfobacteriota bacterium]
MSHHYLGYHEILLDGRDYPSCRQRVESFFQRNELVRYDHIRIDQENSLSSENDSFWPRLEEALERNRNEIRKLTDLLAKEGYGDPGSWDRMEQGYLSKTVHTLAHLLDGFIGIDSCFYNCLEDSHGLSQPLRERIKKDPGNHWLIRVDCFAERESADRLPFLRRHLQQ